MGHGRAPCPIPRRRRALRNCVWSCPECGRIWVLRQEQGEMGSIRWSWTEQEIIGDRITDVPELFRDRPKRTVEMLDRVL